MFKLSYQEAIKIQTAQIAYYRQHVGRKGILSIRHNTKPCPANIHPETPVSVFIINGLVPRGAAFENQWRHRPFEVDRLSGAWHNAIKRGFF